MSSEIKQVFEAPDGTKFDTKAEAIDYLRRPKIEAALLVVTGKNKELVTWLIDNQEKVEAAFDTGTIQRVTKSDKKKLEKALEALKEVKEVKLAFLQDNAEAIAESFRWPSVKRMTDEEKAVAAKNTLMAATENNEKLCDWILANEDAILNSYEAGIEKRAVNPKATEALAAYRAEKRAAKEAAEAAKVEGETTAAA
jgi:predicted metal-dependent TIM-barrel fold hydrolase